MAFLDKFHKIKARKVEVKGNETNPIEVFDSTGTCVFQVTKAGNTTVAGTLAVTGATTQTGAQTFAGSVTLGDAITDAVIIKSPIKSNAAGGTNLTLDDTYAPGGFDAFVEMRANVTDWTNIGLRDSNETALMGMFRMESTADDATAHLVGLEGWGVANGVGVASVEGLRGWAYPKGDTTDTVGTAYGVRGEFSMDAGRANTLTITTEAAGVLARITSGKVDAYTNIHGFVGRFGDMDGGSRTYGAGLLLLDGVEAGTSVLTHGVHVNMAATTGITLAGAMTTGVAITGNVTTGLLISGTQTSAIRINGAGTNLFAFDAVEGALSTQATALAGLSASHKLACTIDGTGTVYIPILTAFS